MANNDDLYIGSASPTIGSVEQRKLTEVAQQMNCMLTKEEFISIMFIYGKAIDRIMRENNLEEEK